MDREQVTTTIAKFRKRPGNKANGKGDADTDAEIRRLAALNPVQYEQQRKDAAEKLGIRTSILDRLVQAERPDDDDNKQGSGISFPEPEPWPEPVNGALLLDNIAKAIRSYVVMPDVARDTAALWVLHSYLLDRALISPRLAITSPVKRCGKTTLLDVLGRLALKPLPTAHVTAAAMFRTIEAYRPTLLIDEADTFLRDNDELRGIINSGHRKGGSVLRTVGDDHEPRAFATYAPCAIALIGRLPETLHDRSVIVSLKRRLPSEPIAAFRSDRAGQLDDLARQAARWAVDNSERVGDADPKMPDGVFNREADNWRPLLAIADVAGWRKRASAALEAAHTADDDESRVAMLLADIKETSMTKQNDDDVVLSSAELAEALAAIEGRPWAEYGKTGKPITQNQLARLLKPLGIAPEIIRQGEKRFRGYRLSQFADAFARYLPEGDSQPCNRDKCDEMGTSHTFQTVTAESFVTDGKCEKSNNDGICHGCTVAKGEKRVCEHCDTPDRLGDPVRECWINGDQHFLHRGCWNAWLAVLDPEAMPKPPICKSAC